MIMVIYAKIQKNYENDKQFREMVLNNIKNSAKPTKTPKQTKC